MKNEEKNMIYIVCNVRVPMPGTFSKSISQGDTDFTPSYTYHDYFQSK